MLLVLMVFSCVLPVSAADKPSSKSDKEAPEDISQAFTQSYTADPSVQIGMVVALKAQDSKVVVPLKSEQIRSMLGIVIPASDAPIVLSPTTVKEQQVLVATSGRYQVVVSSQNGPIKVGDYVTISAINGIGMRASEDQVQVIGKAAGNFSGTANVIGQSKLKDVTGKENTVALGTVPVDIRIGHNPLFQKTVDYVPGFMAKIAVAISNKPVSVARIYLSLAVLLAAAVLTGSMLYSGIRSGMSAVGRNPLSKKSIIKSLIQTVIGGLIVFVAGVFAVYLLLKL